MLSYSWFFIVLTFTCVRNNNKKVYCLVLHHTNSTPPYPVSTHVWVFKFCEIVPKPVFIHDPFITQLWPVYQWWQVHVHGYDLQSLHQVVPPSVLPQEYGGSSGTVQDLIGKWYVRIKLTLVCNVSTQRCKNNLYFSFSVSFWAQFVFRWRPSSHCRNLSN